MKSEKVKIKKAIENIFVNLFLKSSFKTKPDAITKNGMDGR